MINLLNPTPTSPAQPADSLDAVPTRLKPRRRRPGALAAVVAAVALAVTGCTGGPGSRADFVDVLTRDDSFAANEAECIADAVFDRYGEDGDALQKISAAESYEYLSSEDGVDGFDDFFSATVADCTTIGPSSE